MTQPEEDSRVFVLERLRPEHETAILEFELENRAYFAETISDRGDYFYEHFAQLYRTLLAEQAAGTSIGHVLLDEDGGVVGRFNLYEVADGRAEAGYRVARHVSGRGVATLGLKTMCALARDEYALRVLSATTSNANIASQRVLSKAGFVLVGAADVAGQQGLRYELVLGTT
jgi:ribosomal-protein-alanine N-acetyltransferase